jgi:putative tryptophan/tyrosine transport system substrate-binding protein
MRRREFIALLGAAAAWPRAARAQPADRVRRIGVLANFAANDPEMQRRIAVLRDELQKFGWTDGRNVRTEFRFYGSDLELLRSYAAELAHLQPDVIVATPAPAITALQKKIDSIPIVSVVSGDPVRAGFVQSLARPGGNITGFLMFEQTMSAKWLELLKEIAPGVSRVAVMQNPDNTAWRGDFPAIEAVAPSLAVEVISTPVRDAAEIERAIGAFGRMPNGGLLVLPDTTLNVNRELIAVLAAKYRLPAVYPYRFYVAAGGLTSYGVDVVDIYRRVASYVDRILRGVHPGELPVQAPTKFELVINLKTAKMLGLDVPPMLLARADEVFE